MVLLTLKEIASFLGTTCAKDFKISKISIDSREVDENTLFVAIKGENFNGNDYAKSALENGACAVVCENDLGENSIKVKCSNQAFLDIAEGYKKKFSVKTIGITGSVGKTTTKEMMHSIMSQMGKTLKNKGNLNNHIGVPLTIFDLDTTYENAVIEMGMNHFGEIEVLSNCAKPDIAIISNIGISHIEFLGSREGILKAKLEMLSGLKGPIILNGDEPLLRDLDIENEVIYFGIDGKNLDVTCEDIKSYSEYTEFTIIGFGQKIPVLINTVGRHNVINALSVSAVALKLSATPRQIKDGLREFKNTGMRQNIFKHNGVYMIEDCYNASPDSMKASLDVLKEVGNGKKYAVLGSMGELGEMALKAHEEVFSYAKTCADEVFLYGHTWDKISNVYEDKEKLAEKIKNILKDGDSILFKGSRALKIEEVLNYILGEGK